MLILFVLLVLLLVLELVSEVLPGLVLELELVLVPEMMDPVLPRDTKYAEASGSPAAAALCAGSGATQYGGCFGRCGQ